MPESITKREFRCIVQPLMDLFAHKKALLRPKEWNRFVLLTKDRIIANPEQFLGKDLPSEFVIRETVESIFEEYLKEEHVAAV
jgi:hypothetical protein